MQLQRILYLERRFGGLSRSLAAALDVARDHGAALTVAGAVPGERRWSSHRSGGRSAAERWRGAVEAWARNAGAVEVEVRLLSPSNLAAAASAHDLLMTVAHRESLRWPLRYAPEERSLFQQCACPVWVLHPAQSRGVRVVVAGVDVSRQADEAVARRVVRSAGSLARAAGAELHVVHAWSVVGESVIGSASRGGGRHELERLLRSEAVARRARLDRLLERESMEPRPAVVLRHGRPVQVLESVVWERQADVVVLGDSPEREGLRRLLFPPAAEQLLGRVHGSLLVVPSHATAPRPSRHDVPALTG